MLGIFDPNLAAQLAWGRSSFYNDLLKLFKEKKAVIKADLQAALTAIHLSFDLWTSLNRHLMIAIFGHYIDKCGCPQDRLLALKHQLGAYSGENIAATLRGLITDWELDILCGVVVSDNVSNNDTCVAAFFKSLELEMDENDIKACRIRYFGHILNLIAKAFLSGIDSNSFDPQVDPQQLEADLQHWYKTGPIGKLYNIVKYIRALL